MSPLLCVLLSLQTLKNSLEVEEGRGEGERERERERERIGGRRFMFTVTIFFNMFIWYS
jgi:hypothetical protein